MKTASEIGLPLLETSRDVPAEPLGLASNRAVRVFEVYRPLQTNARAHKQASAHDNRACRDGLAPAVARYDSKIRVGLHGRGCGGSHDEFGRHRVCA
jgi:hypothetical protein